MSKFKFTDPASGGGTYRIDATSFAGSGTTAITLLTAGTLSVAGVNNITGSTLGDSIKLLGALTAAQTLSTFGESVAIAAVATIAFDTKNTLAATVDTLFGAAASESITLSNTGTVKSVNIKFSSGSITAADTLTIATPVGPATLVSDTITLTAASKIILVSDSTTAATDILIGSSGNDIITLSDGLAETTPVDAFWMYKSGGGTDTLTGDGGVDKITLSAASSFTYNNGGGTDTITGSTGADSIKLGSGTTGLIYATGGGTGIDTITGTTASDTLTLSSAAVNLKYNSNGTTNADTLTLGSTADTVTLTAASNVSITSGGGADQIIGSSSSDIIALAAASTGTTIRGNGGADTLTGATGADTFSYALKTDSGTSSATRDTITNFEAGTGAASGVGIVDTLKFTGLSGTFAMLTQDRATDTSTTAVAEWAGAGNSQARFYDTGTSIGLLEIDVNGDATTDMSIMLTGVSLANLTTADFSWT
ncbi:MAG: hypothetical protein Q7U57_01680 [Methylovulum sp.]|nr:hypothetical protein [Methylovulum sp.]